jgi:probable rRNA maturation factor
MGSRNIVDGVADLVRFCVAASLNATPHGQGDLEVGVLVTDDDTMRRLNVDFRGIDSTTDVLAFAMREGEDADLHPESLGDIAISLPTARRQASERGHALSEEIAVLSVHGLLHLLGYDHATDDEERAMESQADSVMKQLLASPAWTEHEARVESLLRNEQA